MNWVGFPIEPQGEVKDVAKMTGGQHSALRPLAWVVNFYFAPAARAAQCPSGGVLSVMVNVSPFVLQPIYDKLATDNDYKTIAAQRPKLLERLAHLKIQVTKRMDDPKSLFDLFDW